MKKTYALSGVLAASLIALVAFSPLLSARTQPTRIQFSLAALVDISLGAQTITYTASDGTVISIITAIWTGPITGMVGTTTPVSGTTSVRQVVTCSICPTGTTQVPVVLAGVINGNITLNVGSLTFTAFSGSTSSWDTTGNGILTVNGKTSKVTLQGVWQQGLRPSGPQLLVFQGVITVG